MAVTIQRTTLGGKENSIPGQAKTRGSRTSEHQQATETIQVCLLLLTGAH